jgi:hypothetical protein
MAATSKLGDTSTYGLDFVREASVDISDKKKAIKFIVLTFVELEKCLTKTVTDTGKRKNSIVAAFNTVGIDLLALANEWNPVRGTDYLKDILTDSKAEFLAPLLPVQVEMPKMLEAGKPASEIIAYIKSVVSEAELLSESMARLLVSVSLTWAFEAPASTARFNTRFAEVCLPVMKACCIKADNPADPVQLAVVLETQAWLAGAASDLVAIKEAKPAGSVFQGLYDEDIVEEDTFLTWKDDTDVSSKIPGKSEAVLGSSSFFKWLATAEDE